MTMTDRFRFIQAQSKQHTRGPRHRLASARGVALVIALILLIVITISSMMIMRSSLFSDMVSKNMRSQNLAMQAAEIALRFCERQVADSTAGFRVFALNNSAITDEWQLAANWTAASNRVNTVPAAFIGATVNFPVAPECIVRRLSYEEAYDGAAVPRNAAKPEDRGVPPEYIFFFRITARGYSPDYERDANGNAVSGAEIWLQSTVRGTL